MAGPAIVKPQPGDEVTSAWGQSVADALNGFQTGVVNLTFSASAVSGITAVTFPKPYAAPPVVMLTCGPGGVSPNASVGFRNLTATTMDVQAREVREVAQSATMPVQWLAMGILA